MVLLQLLAGFVVLVAGGELLVRGASGLASAARMSPLVIGLTVVALATSAPEMAVSVSSSLQGSPGLAVGNVVGSNTANILLVLGTSALILPVMVKSRVIRFDIPVMIGLSAVFAGLALDGTISRLDGAILLLALIVYVTVTLVAVHRSPSKPERTEKVTRSRVTKDALMLLSGVGLLVLGSSLLVSASTTLAEMFGVSDLVIGLTVVAVGTSLPELATSVIAARRGERELALGNIVGSNIFNIGAVMASASLTSSTGLPVEPAGVHFDIPVMLAATIIILPLAFSGFVIGRWEAAMLLGGYVAYLAYLILSATGNPSLAEFRTAMLWFVLPLMAIAVSSTTFYEVRKHLRKT